MTQIVIIHCPVSLEGKEWVLTDGATGARSMDRYTIFLWVGGAFGLEATAKKFIQENFKQ